MIRFWTVLVGILLGGSLCAQTISVRSGEHDTFSRLVFTIPQGTTWDFETSQRQAVLRLNLSEATLATDEIFARIPRTRLLGFQAEGPEIALEFGCDCSATVDRYLDFLIIDINDPSPEASPAETTDAQQLDRVQFGYNSLLWRRNGLRTEAGFGPLAIAPDVELPRESSGDEAVPIESIDVVPLESEFNFQADLVRQVAQAASQGLLKPITTPQNDQEAQIETQTTTNEPRTNLVVRSPLDRELDVASALGVTLSGYTCPDGIDFAVKDWGDTRSFGSQTSGLRAQLIDTNNRPDPEIGARLARVYLFFGFGLEAHRVLDMIPGEENIDYLRVMADIVDDGFGAPENPLLPFVSCESDVALWAILAHEALPPDARPNEDAALRALTRLPEHLRAHLGPILSNRFLESGNSEAAADVIRFVSRTGGVVAEGMILARATLDYQRGQIPEAEARLKSLLGGNSETSPRALIELVEARLQRDDPISTETATLAAFYAQQFRDGALGPDLRRIHVLARSKSGQFENAFDALDRLERRDGVREAIALRSQVFDILNAEADDISFLRFSLSTPRASIQKLEDATVNSVASRLISLGFSERALAIITDPAEGDERRERSLLRARAALDQGRPRQAEAALFGETGQDVDLLLAEARSQMGDHQTAGRMYAAAEAEAGAVRSAWLAQDWDALSAADGTVYPKISELVARSSQADSLEARPTSREEFQDRLGALVEESTETRRILGAALSAHSVQNE